METRKITVILESANSHKVIESGAETLGELKRDLAAAGIDYEGKTFREGLSRTELLDDASALPRDVVFRGETTNNLVFTLTTANKKIRSGAMSRAEAYEAVKAAGLQDAVKMRFGKNFTQVGTADLVDFLSKKAPKIATTRPSLASCAAAAKAAKQAEAPVAPVVRGVSRAAFLKLVDILWDAGSLSGNDMQELGKMVEEPDVAPENTVTSTSKVESPWSREDLVNIVRGI